MRHFLLLTGFLFWFSAFSQNRGIAETARQIIDAKKQVVVQFVERDLEQMKILSQEISIDDYKNGLVTAYLNEKQIDKFLNHNYDFTILQQRATNALTMATTVTQMASWDRYPTYSVYLQMMQNYATNYPNLCKLDTIGYSQNGRLIVALKITDNPNIDENEPEFFYSGQMHGDEIVSYIMFLRLIDELLTNYGSNAELTNLVDNIEIWINPLSNPDGCYSGSNNDVSGAIRYAANGTDLNRNYPSPSASYGDHPDGEQWAQETIDMMAFIQNRNFVMSANAHSGAEVVNYPWDTWKSYERVTADDSWWQLVSKEYADTCQANSPSNYLTDVTNSGYTNGADWYYAFGSRQDWVNYYGYCREVTLEWSTDKSLDAELLPDHWIYNRDAMINYLKQVQYGITGIVTDACTGNPIKAKIEIDNHDIDNSHVYSSLSVGDFHRPILAGTYDVIISADGYTSQTFTNISVSNYATTSLNVMLVPFSFSFEQTDNCLAEYNLISVSDNGYIPSWTFPDGSQSSEANPSIWFNSNGTYTVNLQAENCDETVVVSQDIVVDYLLSPPNTNDFDICGVGDATFSATGNGNGDINWYDSENGNLLSTGNEYTTATSSDLTVWVQEAGETIDVFGAKTDNSGTGGYYTGGTSHGLIFDCYEEVLLKSVKVYADGTGIRTISLLNESGAVIYTEDINIPDGESRITLNWDLPVDNNLHLMGPGSPDLFRNGSTSSADLAYPFAVDSYISITYNTADDYGYYYYFYDWEIEKNTCPSSMTSVTASVLPLGISDFSYSGNGSQIQFTDNSTEADTYSWDFGDGTTSTDVNPVHDYLSDGTYNVVLTISNACGNFESNQELVINTVGLNKTTLTNLSVYPNPAKNEITFRTSKTIHAELEIIDISGKIVQYSQLENQPINIENLEKGIYYIRLVDNIKTQIAKFVKE